VKTAPSFELKIPLYSRAMKDAPSTFYEPFILSTPPAHDPKQDEPSKVNETLLAELPLVRKNSGVKPNQNNNRPAQAKNEGTPAAAKSPTTPTPGTPAKSAPPAQKKADSKGSGSGKTVIIIVVVIIVLLIIAGAVYYFYFYKNKKAAQAQPQPPATAFVPASEQAKAPVGNTQGPTSGIAQGPTPGITQRPAPGYGPRPVPANGRSDDYRAMH